MDDDLREARELNLKKSKSVIYKTVVGARDIRKFFHNELIEKHLLFLDDIHDDNCERVKQIFDDPFSIDNDQGWEED